MKLWFAFESGKINAEARCVVCQAQAGQEMQIPPLMISTVGILRALFKKANSGNRLEIEVPGEYLCVTCSDKLKAAQNAEYTDAGSGS
jgi:hypothetical protein